MTALVTPSFLPPREATPRHATPRALVQHPASTIPHHRKEEAHQATCSIGWEFKEKGVRVCVCARLGGCHAQGGVSTRYENFLNGNHVLLGAVLWVGAGSNMFTSDEASKAQSVLSSATDWTGSRASTNAAGGRASMQQARQGRPANLPLG